MVSRVSLKRLELSAVQEHFDERAFDQLQAQVKPGMSKFNSGLPIFTLISIYKYIYEEVCVHWAERILFQ